MKDKNKKILILLGISFFVFLLVSLFLRSSVQRRDSVKEGFYIPEEELSSRIRVPIEAEFGGEVSLRSSRESVQKGQKVRVYVSFDNLSEPMVSADILLQYPKDVLAFEDVRSLKKRYMVQSVRKADNIILLTLVKNPTAEVFDDELTDLVEVEFSAKKEGNAIVYVLQEDGKDKSFYVDVNNQSFILRPTQVLVRVE